VRIAYVINSVEGGGAALPVPAVTRVLCDGGAEVRVFALVRRDGRALPAMAAAGLAVEVREGGERDHAAALRWLDAAVAAWRPTHIWTSLTRATLLGQLVGARRGLPVVSWQHAAYLKPANLTLLRAMSGLSKLWIGDSHSVTALTQQRLHIPAGRLVIWPIFSADADAPQAGSWQPGQMVRLGSLGRLHRVKGYDILIAALRRLRAEGFVPPVPFEIYIAGEGAEREALEIAARGAGIEDFRLVGYVDRPRDFLAKLHLYVQPSRSEGLCIAAHEAMQAGLGVVASAVGELAYTIEPGVSGALVPPEDPIALAETLAALVRHPERLGEMGRQARARVLDRFSAAQFAAQGQVILDRLKAA
jgi:glycosyltransferase involved in cell wall biosynthesis